ncbi:hypothetical protein [Streptomyces sp. A5-4]|uniref:hypothetical protein n=1 Tax=Streptomyces sp. A5-4 TaxID=3384771 RepID=UPI003DA99747
MSGEGYEGRMLRLLPWAGAEGKSCYVLGDGTGYVSRMANGVESIQLGMAEELLGHAADLLANQRVGRKELHFLASRLTESLRDVARVAESRGARLEAVRVAPDGGPGPCRSAETEKWQ